MRKIIIVFCAKVRKITNWDISACWQLWQKKNKSGSHCKWAFASCLHYDSQLNQFLHLQMFSEENAILTNILINIVFKILSMCSQILKLRSIFGKLSP